MPRPPRDLMVLSRTYVPPTQLVLQGDPFLGGVFRAIGRGLGGAARVIGRGIRGGLPLITGLQIPGIPTAPMGHGSSGIPAPPIQITGPPLLGPRVTAPGVVMGPTRRELGAPRRRRRINPLNPRALNRSLRRIEGFRKFALRAGFVPKRTAVAKVFPFRRKRRRAA